MPPLAEEPQEPQDERRLERLPLFHPEKDLEGGFGAQSLGIGLNCQDWQILKYFVTTPLRERSYRMNTNRASRVENVLYL